MVPEHLHELQSLFPLISPRSILKVIISIPLILIPCTIYSKPRWVTSWGKFNLTFDEIYLIFIRYIFLSYLFRAPTKRFKWWKIKIGVSVAFRLNSISSCYLRMSQQTLYIFNLIQCISDYRFLLSLNWNVIFIHLQLQKYPRSLALN